MRRNGIKTIAMIVLMMMCFTVTAFGIVKEDYKNDASNRYKMLWCDDLVWTFFDIFFDGGSFTYDDSSTHESKTLVSYFLYDYDDGVIDADTKCTSDIKTIITYEGTNVDWVKNIHRLTDSNEISRVSWTEETDKSED